MKTPDYVGEDRERFLKRMLKTKSHSDKFLGHKITVLPEVFLPTASSKLLAKHIRVKKGARVIDIGTGTGVLALIAGLKGASGYAVDINPNAVRNAQLNLSRHKIATIKAVESDLFSKIPKPERFDLIIFNRPFWDSYDGKRMRNIVEKGFSDPTGRISVGFLKDARNQLTHGGRILMSVAEWEPLAEIEQLFRKFGYKYKLLGKQSSRRDKRRVYRAYELRLKT